VDKGKGNATDTSKPSTSRKSTRGKATPAKTIPGTSRKTPASKAATVVVKISVKIAKPHDALRPLHQNNTPPYSPTNIALYFINKGLFYSAEIRL